VYLGTVVTALSLSRDRIFVSADLMDPEILAARLRSRGVGEKQRKINHGTANLLYVKPDPAPAVAAASSLASSSASSSLSSLYSSSLGGGAGPHSKGSFGPRLDFLKTSRGSRLASYHDFVARELPSLLSER
jgi:hypothetical protein